MRIAGWVLFVGGFLLCASVAWATLGFLLMGVGLISLQVAERNRNRARLALASHAESHAAPPEIRAAPAEMAQVPAATATLRPSRADASYDEEAWRRLVENDSDLLRVTSVLQAYGQPYVDELARACLTAGDSSHLPEIVDAIVRKAKRNLARRNAASQPSLAQSSLAPNLDRPSRAANDPPHQANDRTDPRYQRVPAAALRAAVAPAPMPAEPVAGAAEVRPVEVPLDEAPIEEALVIAKALAEPPAPIAGQRNTTITSADDDLTKLIGKFASDSTFARKN